ncbi:MAG: hypothetical protein WCS27_04800 [Victivallaceae bacterium]
MFMNLQSVIAVAAAFILSAAGFAAEDEWKAPTPEILPEAKASVPTSTQAKWIWFRTREYQGGVCYYRYKLKLDEPVVKAWANCIMEHFGKFYVNAREIKGKKFPQRTRALMPLRYDFTSELKPGKNLFCMEIKAIPSHSGDMILRGEIELKSGKKVRIFSTPEFKVSPKASAGWLKADYDDSTWKPAVVQGDAYTTNWCVRGDILEHFGTPEENAEYKAIMKKINSAPIPKSIEQESFPKVSIKYNGDMAGIDINGKIYPPIIRLGLSKLPDGVSDRDSIIKFDKSGCRIFEGTYSLADSPIGKYDPASVDSVMRTILHFAPDGYIIFPVQFARIEEWAKAHPEEMISYYRKAVPSEMNYRGFTPNQPSAASKLFREAYIAELKDLCRQIKATPWGKRVIGFRIIYGWFGEWITYGSYCGMPDHSRPMTEAFRAFLRKKYKTDKALQEAWHDPKVTFDTAAVPGYKERWGNKHFLRNPDSTDRQTWDYYINSQEVMSDLLIALAKALKEELPDVIVGAWDCYDLCRYSPEGQHVWGDKLLASKYIDFLSMPYGYDVGARRAGDPGLHEQLLSRFKRTGKLAFLEADIRAPHELKRGSTPHLTMKNEEEYDAVIKRDFANMFFFNGQGIQFNQFSVKKDDRDSFNYVEVYKAMHRSIKLWKEVFKNPPKLWGCDTAVVYDSKQSLYHGYPEMSANQELLMALGTKSVESLMLSGHVFDFITIEDFLLSKHKYKTVVFLNQFYLSDERRKQLAEKTHEKGVTAVWLYAPGLVTDKGFSDAAMEELTGIKLKAARGQKLPLIMTLEDGRMAGLKNRTEFQRVSCTDASAIVWGCYNDNKAPAFVKKVLPSGAKAIFSGVPINNPVLWGSILDDAGDHSYTEPGILIRANDKYLMIHVGEAGGYYIFLPAKCREAKDLFTGEVVAHDASRFTVKSKGPKTWFLKITK